MTGITVNEKGRPATISDTHYTQFQGGTMYDAVRMMMEIAE